MQFLNLALFIGLSSAAAIHQRTSYYAADPCAIVKNVTVAAGDTLGAIALAQQTTVDAILLVNPSIASPNAIFADQVIAIPAATCVVEPTAPVPVPTATCVPAGDAPTYTVVAGDVLTDIALDLGITLPSLVAANADIDPDVLDVGQVINVPVCTS
ncbi:intracellular hyphae protein 1 [Phlyctema vagabunda]|uniref:Intracellular hyphae protein 1 n=1 Tax=Phlyctema vagabunda TaxID=108571 RepID=A0ABR4PSX7_9HELO